MANNSKIWKGNWTFILAAAGSAVGLGNIWKFPYMVGSNGGSAFVIVYLICVLIIGLPVMASEILIGKYGRKSAGVWLSARRATTFVRGGRSLVRWACRHA